MPGKEIKGRSPIANYRDGGRTGFREGLSVDKGPKKPKKSPDPFREKKPKKSPGPLGRGEFKFTGPPSQSNPKPKQEPPKGGRRPGPSKGPSPEQLRKKPKVEEDWAAKGGRIK